MLRAEELIEPVLEYPVHLILLNLSTSQLLILKVQMTQRHRVLLTQIVLTAQCQVNIDCGWHFWRQVLAQPEVSPGELPDSRERLPDHLMVLERGQPLELLRCGSFKALPTLSTSCDLRFINLIWDSLFAYCSFLLLDINL